LPFQSCGLSFSEITFSFVVFVVDGDDDDVNNDDDNNNDSCEDGFD
jgi:hypothetical protein